MAFTGGAGAKTYARTNSVYSGTTTWQQTDAAVRGIRSDDHDNHDQDMATAINTSLQKNGDNSLTASIPAAGFGMTGVGVLGSATEASITSASTADLLGSAALFNLITGTVTITSLGTGANRFKIARFNGALTLTYNATTLITPGAQNIITVAGDTMGVISDASSNARIIWYERAAGVQVGLPTGGDKGVGNINIAGSIYINGNPTNVTQSVSKAIASASATLTTGNSPVTLFTVTGVVAMRTLATVGTGLTSTGSTGTLSVGVTGSVDVLLKAMTANGTKLPTGAMWAGGSTPGSANDGVNKAEGYGPGTPAAATALGNQSGWVAVNNTNVICTIATNSMTAGAITFYCEWYPISSGATVVAA